MTSIFDKIQKKNEDNTQKELQARVTRILAITNDVLGLLQNADVTLSDAQTVLKQAMNTIVNSVNDKKLSEVDMPDMTKKTVVLQDQNGEKAVVKPA